jgi:ABC-type glycerol-3-phosphate transport system permease component
MVGRTIAPRLRALALTTLTALLATLFVWPVLCMLGASLNRIDVSMNPLIPFPAQFSLKLYRLMVVQYEFQRYIWNSLVVACTSTALGVFASSLAGYALAKYTFPGRKLLFVLVLGIMLLPAQTMIVPRFVVMRRLALIDNYWGLILPAVGGGAQGIFVMRQFMLRVPSERLEAARLDGANEFVLFVRIVRPTIKVPLAVLATLSLQQSWNALLWPQILITDPAKMLLMPAIARLNALTWADPYARPVAWAASLTAALLPLALYASTQKSWRLSGGVRM